MFSIAKIARGLKQKNQKPAVKPAKPAVAEAAPHQQAADQRRQSLESFTAAHAAYEAGDRPTALSELNKALDIDPKNVRALAMKADILADRGDVEIAAKLCQKVLKIEPQHFGVHNLLMSLGIGDGYQDKVASAYSSEMRKSASRHLSTARYLNLHSRFDEAAAHARVGMEVTSILNRDDIDDLHQRLALEQIYALEMSGRIDDALACVDRLDGIGNADKNVAARARLEMERGNFREAATLFDLDNTSGPNANRVIKEAVPILYGLDRIGEAHARYRLRRSSQALRSAVAPAKSVLDQPLHALKGAGLFLFAESGPGDEIRFSTLYGEIETQFDPVAITCDPRLKNILSRSYPSIKFLPAERHRKELRRGPVVGRDDIKDKALQQFATEELIWQATESDVAGTTLDVLADLRKCRADFAHPSRLKADPHLVEMVAQHMQPGTFKIGISWRSLLRSSARNRHYFQPRDLAKLGEIPGVEFWVLQAGAEAAEIEELRTLLPHVQTDGQIDLVDDFDGQAALLENMDAVVSPFTSMAELSGALGRPTLLLCNSYQTTWRKNPDGTDVWHPSGRVMGAETVGDRIATIEETARALVAMRSTNVNSTAS